MNDGTLFSPKAIAQLRAMYQRFAAEVRNETGHRQRTGVYSPEVKFVAKTDGSGITARSSDTPGSGTVTIYRRDPSSGDLAIVQANGANWTRTCYNWTATAIGATTWITVFEDPFGDLWIDAEEC